MLKHDELSYFGTFHTSTQIWFDTRVGLNTRED